VKAFEIDVPKFKRIFSRKRAEVKEDKEWNFVLFDTYNHDDKITKCVIHGALQLECGEGIRKCKKGRKP
jgi:hypothetical protein